jgi:hypothetical protein
MLPANSISQPGNAPGVDHRYFNHLVADLGLCLPICEMSAPNEKKCVSLR